MKIYEPRIGVHSFQTTTKKTKMTKKEKSNDNVKKHMKVSVASTLSLFLLQKQ